MPTLAAARNSNLAYSPSYVPVIVVFGGTSGIGEAITKALANYTNGRAHIIIVGRNEAAANAIIQSLHKPAEADVSESKYEFISCDINLMKNVHALTKDLTERLPKINYLILSARVFGLGGRQETEEGIDVKLASRYYSRFSIIDGLLPLLRKANDAGEDASAMSILGAGKGKDIDFDDLGLKQRYKGWKAVFQSIAYNDLMIEGYSKKEPEIGFTHIFPGKVDTNGLRPSSLIGRFVMFFFRPLMWALMTTAPDCAEYMIYALLNAEKGMNRRNEEGDDIGLKEFPLATEEQKETFWTHSVQETSEKNVSPEQPS